MLRSKYESLGSCKGGESNVKRQVRRCQVGTLLLLLPSTHGKGRHVLLLQMCWQPRPFIVKRPISVLSQHHNDAWRGIARYPQ